MKSYSIEKPRHLVLRASAGDVLPDDVLRVISDQGISCGWIRASGVLGDLELRAFDSSLGGLGPPRRITGPVQALSIEGSIGLSGGEPSMGLRAVLARETDRGMEVLAGEITTARVVALEAYVTGFEDLAVGRGLDPVANVVLLGDASEAHYLPDDERSAPPMPSTRVPAAAKAAPVAWGEAITASADAEASSPTANRGQLGGAIPARPQRPQRQYDEALVPEPGDVVEHFAFGPSEVLKSDGDRLHLRVAKDQRIREIALEMLKVTPLESDAPHRRFRLDRKL